MKPMKFLMISCQKAAGLVDKKHAVGLSLPERAQLRIHTAMCDACRRYMAQSGALEVLLHGRLAPPSDTALGSDPRDEKLIERILSPKK